MVAVDRRKIISDIRKVGGQLDAGFVRQIDLMEFPPQEDRFRAQPKLELKLKDLRDGMIFRHGYVPGNLRGNLRGNLGASGLGDVVSAMAEVELESMGVPPGSDESKSLALGMMHNVLRAKETIFLVATLSSLDQPNMSPQEVYRNLRDAVKKRVDAESGPEDKPTRFDRFMERIDRLINLARFSITPDKWGVYREAVALSDALVASEARVYARLEREGSIRHGTVNEAMREARLALMHRIHDGNWRALITGKNLLDPAWGMELIDAEEGKRIWSGKIEGRLDLLLKQESARLSPVVRLNTFRKVLLEALKGDMLQLGVHPSLLVQFTEYELDAAQKEEIPLTPLKRLWGFIKGIWEGKT